MSQIDLILSHLESGKSITSIEALNLYGCFRLGARIHDLKEMGHNINSKMIKKNDKWFAEYTLIIKPQTELFNFM